MSNEKKSPAFNVTLEIPSTEIAGLLCSAFEGGSNYWMRLTRTCKSPAPENLHSHFGGSVDKYIDYPLCGGSVEIVEFAETDREEDKKHTLDRAAIERGLALFVKGGPDGKMKHHFADFLKEDTDATTGDVFLQLCVLGDVVYG